LKPRKQIVVNADDFGFTPDVNAGIVEAHRRGILTATTLMANGEAFEDAVRLARETPSLDIGAHLVLVGGNSVLTGKALPLTVGQLLAAMVRREIRVYDELRTQVERIARTGLRLTHLDTHKHTHLAPPVLEAVARIGEAFDIPWVRRPFDFPLNAPAVPTGKRLLSRALSGLRPLFHAVLTKRGCRTTDHFAGFAITGRFRTAELGALLDALPSGSTELMCHPGYCRESLLAARTRLKESRERELEALISPEAREAIERNGIDLTSYRAL
jgi:hopanoid biosynthesis associated protein HpnK